MRRHCLLVVAWGLLLWAPRAFGVSGKVVTNLADLAEAPHQFWSQKIYFIDEFVSADHTQAVSIGWKGFFLVQGRGLSFYAPDTMREVVHELYPGDRIKVEAMVRLAERRLVVTATRITSETRTLSATAWKWGTIEPAGEIKVPVGGKITFTVTANDGHWIDKVLVDDEPVGTFGPGNTAFVYTFTGVSRHHTITATFGPAAPTPLPAAAPAAAPEPTPAPEPESAPEEAEAEPAAFTIRAEPADHGTIDPSGAVTVARGEAAAFALTAAEGSHIEDVFVDGESVGTFGQGSNSFRYVFENVAADHAISAVFAIDMHELTLQAEPGGIIRGESGLHPAGTRVMLLAVAEGQTRFARWKGDVPAGCEQENPLTVTVDRPRSITAHFVPLEHEPVGIPETAGEGNHVAAVPETEAELPEAEPEAEPEALEVPAEAPAWSPADLPQMEEDPASAAPAPFVPAEEMAPAAAPEEEPAPADKPAQADEPVPAAPAEEPEPETPNGLPLSLVPDVEAPVELASLDVPEPAVAPPPEVLVSAVPAPPDAEFMPPAGPLVSCSVRGLSLRLPAGRATTNAAFKVWNAGVGRMKYAISRDVAWCSVSPKIGTSTGEHDTIEVTFSAKDLAPGTYDGSITVAVRGAADVLPCDLPVTLTVLHP